MPQDGPGGTLSVFKVLNVGLYYVSVLRGVLVRIVGSSLRSLFPRQGVPATPRDRSEYQNPVSANTHPSYLVCASGLPKTCRSDTPTHPSHSRWISVLRGKSSTSKYIMLYIRRHPPLPSRSTGVWCQQAGASAIDVSGNPTETSVLVEAARSGSGEMIDTVAFTMSDLLTEKRVCVLLCPDGAFTMF